MTPSLQIEQLVHELDHLIRARYPIIALETPEEERALALVRQVTTLPRHRDKPVLLWSIARGLRRLELDGGQTSLPGADSPSEVLAAIDKMTQGGLVVLADFAPHLLPYGQEEAVLVRQLRELAFSLKGRRGGPTVIVVGVHWPLLPTLAHEVKVLGLPLPDRAEVDAFLAGEVERYAANPDIAQPLLAAPEREPLTTALLGLTLSEIDNLVARAVVTHRRLDAAAVPLFLREKRDAIRQSGSLTYVEPEPPDRFAGYPGLRRLLDRMAGSLTDAARQYGLPRPKGLLLVGLPGCGKDLCKRVAASVLGLPLLDLDFGAVMGARGGVIGQAHQEVKHALQIATTVRCILGVSEFEKALGGLGSSASSDGGETARTISYLLNWMAEQEDAVIFATANDVRALAPEQIRHGRFDHILFVDLPRHAARQAIFAVHLRRVGREPRRFDLPALADASEHFSGAEIAAAVKEGLALAFAAGREVDTVDLVRAARGIRPLAVVRAEEIEALRAWARNHGIPSAEGEEESEPVTPTARTVEL